MSLLSLKSRIIIPTNWDMIPIGKALISSQYGTSQGNSKTGVPVVGMRNLQNGKVVFNDLPFVVIDETEKERLLLHDGDILLNRTNSYDLVGKVGYVEKAIEAVFASYLVRLKVDKKKSDPRFVAVWLTSFWAEQMLKKIATRAVSQVNLNPTEFKKFCLIPVPPLPEQKAIAALLSTWDQAIEKTERLIQAKENSLKAKIQRMMGKEAIDANGWPIVHLGKLFSEVTRKVGRKELTPFSISAGIGFVSQCEKWGKDISGAQYKNYTHLKAGEFSYNKGNSKQYQQGCVYLLKEGEICVPNVFISFKARANKDVVPEFFEHYFIADYHARELKRYITSGARSDGLLNLDKKDFFKIMVPCPSPGEQKNIAESLNALQYEIDLLKKLAEKYKTQKRGLMQKVLSGQWRIRPEIVERYKEA